MSVGEQAGRDFSRPQEAEQLHTAADGLLGVADEIEHRLDDVLERIGPPIWAGRAAEATQLAARAARDDLRVAAVSLRELGGELHLAAGVLAWRDGRAPATVTGLASTGGRPEHRR